MPQGLAHHGWWFRPHVSTEHVLWASTGGGAICSLGALGPGGETEVDHTWDESHGGQDRIP